MSRQAREDLIVTVRRVARARLAETQSPDRERHALDAARPHRFRATQAGVAAKLRRHFTFFLVEVE